MFASHLLCGDIVIFRLFKNGEELSFANVDTLEEAVDLLLDPFAYSDVRDELITSEDFYAMARVSGNMWEIRGDQVIPAEPVPVEPIALDCGCRVAIMGYHGKIVEECKYHSPLSHR